MKLRLPHQFQAALMAAIASVSFTTLSTGTLAVVTGATLLAGQQAQAVSLDDAVLQTEDITSTITVDKWTANQMTVAIELDVAAFKDYLTTTWIAGTASVRTIFNVEGTWNTATGGRTDTEGLNINGSSTSKYGTPYGQGTSPGGNGTAIKLDNNLSESLKFNASTNWDNYEAMSVVLTFNGGSEMTATWYIKNADGTTSIYYGANSGVKWSTSTAFTPDGTIKNIDTSMVNYMAVFDSKLNQADSATIASAVFTRPPLDYGMEFSGDVFTIEHAASQLFHSATFSSWYQDEEGQWKKGSHTWTGTSTTYYVGEEQQSLTGSNNSFWRRLFGDANSGDTTLLGNTIRLARATTGTVYYEAQFSPFRLGGIIAEAGDATYIVGRKSGECAITLQAREGESANMYIAADTILSVGAAATKNGNTFTIATGGTWTVDTGKTLIIGQHDGSTLSNAGAINFNDGANVTMNGGGTVDLSHTNALTINSNLTIGGDVTVKFANTTLAGSIENAGTATFDGLSISDGASLTNSGTLSLGGNVSFAHAPITNSGTVVFANDVLLNLDTLNAVQQDNKWVYTLFSGSSAVTMSSLSESNLTITGGTLGKNWDFTSPNQISYTLNPEKVWTAEIAAYWNYTDANWNGQPFNEGDTAVFSSGEHVAIVNAPVKAASIKVTGSGEWLQLYSEGDGSLSAAAVTVEGAGTNFLSSCEITGVEEFSVGEGALWGITADQTLGAGTNNGAISIGSGHTLTLTAGSTAAALLQSVQGGGNIKLTQDTLFAGSTDSEHPTSTQATGTLIVDGVTLSIGSTNTGTYDHTYVNMSSFTHVQLDGGTLYIHNDEFDLNGLTVNSGKTGTVRIYDTASVGYNTLNLKGTTKVDGTLTFKGDWKQTFTIEALTGTGEVKFEGLSNNEGATKEQIANLRGGTIGNLTISGDKAATVIVNVNGDLTVDSSATINKGVMNVSGSLTVNSKALDLSSGGSATGTLNIKSGGTVTLKKATNSSLWLDDGAHLNLEAGGTLDLQKYDVIIAGRANDASIVATTNNQQYGTGNTNITVTNADVTAQANITLANKLVNSTVDAGTHTVTLTNAANVLAGATVGEGGTLNINAAAELKSAIANSGTVAFNSNVTATGLELHANQAVLLDTNGAYTLDTSGNYFAGATADYIVLVEGGTVNPSGHTLTMSDTAYDIQSSGLAVANVSWGSGWIKNCQYYQNEGSAKVTEIYANAQELGATCNRIRVTNASLEVDDEAYNLEVDNAHITVTGTNVTIDMLAPLGGTSTIELQTGMTLNLPEINFAENDAETTLRLKHADATDYAVTDNSNLANAMVRITSLKDDAVRNGQVTITAAAGTSGVYRVNSEGFDVDATRLEKIADSRVQVNNTLNVKEIHNDAAGKTGDFVLTKGVDAAALDTVIATSGDIEFYEMSSAGAAAQLAKLDIAANKSVSFYSSGMENAKVEASVTVVGTLTAGAGATLNANLEMAAGSHLDVSADGGVHGLLMGSTVTLNEGMNLADYTGDWSAWEDGTKYALFTGVDGLNIGSGMGTGAIDYTQWVDASKYFTNITEQNRYFLCYGGAPADNQNSVLQATFDGSNVGMVYIMAMPEPTTGTLSLLALCALAARRRRK